jgi:GTPase
MHFVDEVKISLKSGKGGPGCISFMRQSFMPKMGPDGGSGGRGGSVYFEATHNMQSLLDFKFRPKYEAGNGSPGTSADCDGKGGEDILVKVPVGTLVKDLQTGSVLLDLVEPGKQVLFMKGGRGGLGNMHFASATRQAPEYAQPGEMGQAREVILELRLLADVGLVGFPNAGKSTFISRTTKARPKIADYPFTTLVPNLGLVRGTSLDYVLADIPGIIEGASEGRGLGDRFLRHCERTRVLILMLDLDPHTGRKLNDEYQSLRKELGKFSKDLSEKPFFVFVNKVEAFADLKEEKAFDILSSKIEDEKKCLGIFEISAVSGLGVDAALAAIEAELKAMGPRFWVNEISHQISVGDESLLEDDKESST